ncbi:Serine palmitoyltransferase 2 [Mactra antiquata]
MKNYLQWYFVLLQIKDTIKEGDINRLNIVLKHMIPFFYSHSELSKYFIECIDFILKTEHTLSPYMALKVKATSFVNPKGRPGKNKAADMQTENEVKYLKSLIRSLGSNKTENSIRSITKAGPVMLDIVNSFNEMTGSKDIKTTHKMKSRSDDIKAIVDKIIELNLWGENQSKELASCSSITKTPFEFDLEAFKTTLMWKVQLLMQDVPVVIDGEQEN